jgi:signal transduction histidine kinase/DNA-binding response OmpR family regulator/ligand-binding sensor domain-containing protein
MNGFFNKKSTIIPFKFWAVLFTVLYSFSLATYAHLTPKVIQSITLENGGTNTVIYDLKTDGFNRLWIASTEGVFVYNGKQAKKIWPLTGSANAYSIVNHQNDVYVSGTFGLVKFNARSLQAEPIEALAKSNIYAFTLSNNKIVYNQFDNGLYQFNQDSNEILSIDIDKHVASNDIKAIHTDKQGIVWVAVQANDSSKGMLSGGLLALKNGKIIGNYLHNNNEIIANITAFNNNLIISTTNSGIIEFNPTTKEIVKQHYPRAKSPSVKRPLMKGPSANSLQTRFPAINNLSIDNNGCFWLATMSQAQSTCNNQINKLSGSYLKELPLADYQTVYFDAHNEIVWLGAISGGVRGIHVPKDNALSYSMINKNDKGLNGESLSGESIYSVNQAQNGDIWLAYNGEGIDIIDAKTNKVEHIKVAEQGSRANHILSFAFDPQGTAFVGSFRGGVWYKKTADKTFKPFIKSSNEKVQKTIVMDFAFETERVWVATIRELFELDKTGEIIRTLPKGELINQGNIYGVMTLDDANMLLATSNGLINVDKKSLKQTLLNPVDANAVGCDDGMMDLTRDTKGNVWYVSRALCKYDPVTKKVSSESIHPLFVAGMTAVLALPDGRIVGHDGKIAIFDPKDKSVQTITAENGHFIDDSTQNFGAMTLINNQLVVALSKGLLWYDINKAIPSALQQNPLFIKKLMVMNKSKAISAEMLKSTLNFPYTDKVAFLDFEQINYFNQKFTYQVEMPSIIDTPLVLERLDGFAIPTAIEGNHQIKVLSQKADQTIDNLTFAINVEPPYWRTPLAYVIYLLLIMFAVFVFYSLRVSAIKRENKRLDLLVTERTKQLKVSLHDKERMFENISHEFRTPLTVIIGNIDILLKEEKNKRVDIIHRQSHRLLALVEQLLKLAELKAVKKTYQTVNLSEFVPIQISALGSLCEQFDVQLTLDDTANLPTVMMLEDSMMLVISNMVGNAIKYATQGTEIKVSVTVNYNALKFTVINQAKSFDTNTSKERYVRANDKSNIDGNGIGLAIMEEVAKLNDGEFSINYQQGVVCAEIIMNTQPAIITTDIEATAESVLIAKPTSTLATVMIVEDEQDLREFITDILAESFKIISCKDGSEALAHLKSDNSLPDIILSDVVMPNLTGIELTHAIKNDDELRSIPVVLLSAKTDLSSLKSGYTALADDYIAKPFNSELLVTKLTNLVATISAAKEKALGSLLTPHVKPKTEIESKISALMATQFSDDTFSVHVLAEHLSMSEKTLNRRLQSLYGVSFSQLIRDYRLEKSKEMLITGMSAKETTYQCGFSSQAYFGQCFKEKFDVSPGLFQRQFTS